MKRYARTVSALAALLLLTAAGCLRIQQIGTENGPETDAPDPPAVGAPETDEPDSPGTDPASPETDGGAPDFTLEDLNERNDIRALLASHETVTVTRIPGEDSTSVNCFWMKDGELAYCYVNTVTYAGWDDGEPMTGVYRGGWYKGLDFEVHPEEPVTVTFWLSPSAAGGGLETTDPASFLTGYLPGYVTEEPRVVASDGETVTILVNEIMADETGEDLPCVNRITVDRDTLEIRSLEWEYDMYGEHYADGLTVAFDGERIGKESLDAWEGTRTVSFDFITETGTEDAEFVLPEEWRMDVWAAEGWMVSGEYSVPGGDSFTVSPGTGGMTLWVRDEANLPVDVPEGEGWDTLGFSRSELTEANRITNLTARYGTVTVSETAEYGESDTSFFRYGEQIVMIGTFRSFFAEGEETEASYGSAGDLDFSLLSEGVAASAIPGGELPEPEYVALYTNAEGEFYRNDLFIAGSVPEGDVIQAERENGVVTFLVEAAYETGDRRPVYFFAVEEETLRILSYGEYEGEWSCTASFGETVPFAEEYERAMEDTRTLTYHTQLGGEARDYLYVVPSSWSFSLSLGGEGIAFTSDEAGLQPAENRIPADGEDHEIWVSDAKG